MDEVALARLRKILTFEIRIEQSIANLEGTVGAIERRLESIQTILGTILLNEKARKVLTEVNERPAGPPPPPPPDSSVDLKRKG